MPVDKSVRMFRNFIIASLVAHLLFGIVGGVTLVPWLMKLLTHPETVAKPKKVEEPPPVEMVEATIAEPPPPQVQQPPPQEPPPKVIPPPQPTPPPPQPTPAPVVEAPKVAPEPVVQPVQVANPVFPVAAPPAPPPQPTPPAPVVPAVTAPAAPVYVKAKFYQRREIEYPYDARKRRIEGTAIIEVVFGEDGKPVVVELFSSSGHAILDKAAQRHFMENGFAPPGHSGRYRIEVEFKLVAR